jgi:hypothetical protein
MIDADTAMNLQSTSLGDPCSWEEVYASFGCSVGHDPEGEDDPG